MKLIGLASIVFGLSSLASFACEQDGALALTPQDPSAPVIYVNLPDIPISAPFTIGVTSCDQSNGTLTFDAIMPAHQHGMNYAPEITATKPGQFEINNVVFHMPGAWEIQIAFTASDQTYLYTKEVMVE